MVLPGALVGIAGAMLVALAVGPLVRLWARLLWSGLA